MRGSIVKKPNGRYYIVYYLGKKQKWEKVPDPNTKKRAEHLLAKRVKEIHDGEYREIKNVLFREFAERWLADYVSDPNHVKGSTATAYRRTFESRLVPFFGDYPLAALSPDLVQRFVAQLSREGLAAATIRTYLAPFGKCLKHAVRWGYLRTDPTPLVELPRIKQREAKFLTPDQLGVLLENIPEPWKVLFTTAAMTGMRIGELVAMRWANLNLKALQYSVRERLYNGEFDTPKSDQSRRTVDLTPSVVLALKAHRKVQNERRLARGSACEDNDLIFCQDNGKKFSKQDFLRDILRESLAAAELPEIHFHALRHSYVALLIDQGAHPRYIQRQLGHASIQQTFDTYGHLMPDAGATLAPALDRRVFGTAP